MSASPYREPSSTPTPIRRWDGQRLLNGAFNVVVVLAVAALARVVLMNGRTAPHLTLTDPKSPEARVGDALPIGNGSIVGGSAPKAPRPTIRLRGTAVESPSADPLAGVTICVYAQPTTPCVTSGVSGDFDIPVPASSETGVTLALTGRDPVLVPFVTGTLDQDGFKIGMPSASWVSGVGAALGVAYPPDASAGFLAAYVSTPGSQANLPGVRIAIAPASGKGPLYLASNGAPNPSATSTSALGVGFFGSVAPGVLTVTFAPAPPKGAFSCTPNFGGWPSALPNAVRVPIAAGFDTHVGMACR